MSELPVTLEPAASSDAALLANLLELYCHDLSEVFPVEPGPDGRFGYEKLPLYWSEPEKRFPFLIRMGEKTVGFVLVTRGSPASDDPEVLDIAELFVLRRHRRSGCGRQAVNLLWHRMPGRWLVRVSEGNQHGMEFWEPTISAYTRGEFTKSLRAGSPHGWHDFSFTTARV